MKYEHPVSTPKLPKKLVMGAEIIPASEETETSGKMHARLLQELRNERKKNQVLTSRVQALENGAIQYVDKLTEKIAQRETEIRCIQNILKTQAAYSSFEFPISMGVPTQDWFVQLKQKVEAESSAAINGAGFSYDEYDMDVVV